MLILSRGVGESVRIGEEIIITVLGVRGREVLVGIDAPKALPVHREEIAERIARGGPTSARDLRGTSVLRWR